jgi:hypothetical protein
MHLNKLPVFNSQQKDIIKKYPNSKDTIEEAIQNLKKNPAQGNQIPGFRDVQVRKMRIGLPEYNLSQSKGLRLVFVFHPYKEEILPLLIYKKGILTEKQILSKLKKVLKRVLTGS